MSTFRTFRAPDARSALAMVKATLGAEAIIVSTREVKQGLWGQKEIEVTAALPEAPPALSRGVDPSTWKPRPANDDEAARAQAPLSTSPSEARFFDNPGGAGLALDSAQALHEALAFLKTEVESLKRELRSASRTPRTATPAAGTVEAFEARLVLRGMEDALARELAQYVTESAPLADPDGLLLAARAELTARLPTAAPPWAQEGKQVYALVGPTGVGKTTTLAKIAAQALMYGRGTGQRQRRVSLITIDTYRIGATDQLSKYAEIMGLSCAVARDRVELRDALKRAQGSDLTLIDTAGRSVSEAVRAQADMLRSVPEVQLILVLAVSSGWRELSFAADRYRALKPEQLILTKLDEAVAPAGLVSPVLKLDRPVSAVADGQRVPEDIHALSSLELTSLVLGLGGEARARVGD